MWLDFKKQACMQLPQLPKNHIQPVTLLFKKFFPPLLSIMLTKAAFIFLKNRI